MPQRVREQVNVARFAHQLRRAGGIRGDLALFRQRNRAHVAAREDGEVAAVGFRHVAQEVHGLHGDGRARFRHADAAQRFAPIRVGVAGEAVAGRARDGLRHAEQDVRPHDVHDVVEDGRAVDEVDEGLAVAQEFAPVHEAVRVEVRRVRHEAVVADGQLRAAIRLIARQFPHPIHLACEEGGLIRVEHAFQVQVAIHLPLLALRRRQGLHLPHGLAIFDSGAVARRRGMWASGTRHCRSSGNAPSIRGGQAGRQANPRWAGGLPC